LTSLSDAAAESFGKLRESGLNGLNMNALEGLTSLSDAAAESLAKHEGWLRLNDSMSERIDSKKK